MHTMTHARNQLARETRHLTGENRHQLAAMIADAEAFARACPLANTAAIAVKLLTLHEGVERWARLLIAQAALEAVAYPIAA